MPLSTLVTISGGISTVTGIVSAVTEFIKITRKDKKNVDPELYGQKIDFYKHIYNSLADYSIKVEYLKYMEEEIYDYSEIAVEGLELLNRLIQELMDLEYFKQIDSEYRKRLIVLGVQCKNDLIYYEKYFEEDTNDPSQKIIDSVITLYKASIEKLIE